MGIDVPVVNPNLRSATQPSLRAIVDALLFEEYGTVSAQQFNGQVVYTLDLQRQLEERVLSGLVPAIARPTQGDLHNVSDFLNSPCVDAVFQEHNDFQGNFCLLSLWADGGRVFPNRRGGSQKTLWAVMVFFFFRQE